MSEIDKTVQEHLIKLLNEINPDPSSELIEQASVAWLEKLNIFKSQFHLLKMAETESFTTDNKNVFLALSSGLGCNLIDLFFLKTRN